MTRLPDMFRDVLGKVAETGNQVKADGYILKVMEVDNKRIEKN